MISSTTQCRAGPKLSKSPSGKRSAHLIQECLGFVGRFIRVDQLAQKTIVPDTRKLNLNHWSLLAPSQTALFHRRTRVSWCISYRAVTMPHASPSEGEFAREAAPRQVRATPRGGLRRSVQSKFLVGLSFDISFRCRAPLGPRQAFRHSGESPSRRSLRHPRREDAV